MRILYNRAQTRKDIIDMNKQTTNKWQIIKNCIQEAASVKVDQSQVSKFLKNTFNNVLDSLARLVQEGLDLSNEDVLTNLKDLELALAQLPQQRVFAFDVATVIDEFEEFMDRFYVYLSIPSQNAENSISSDWIIGRFDSFVQELDTHNEWIDCAKNGLAELAEIKDSLESTVHNTRKEEEKKALRKALRGLRKDINERLYDQDKQIAWLEQQKENLKTRFVKKMGEYYLFACYNLIDNGSEMIRAKLANASEGLADALMSENMMKEASLVWHLTVRLMSEDNNRITQREARLTNAIDCSLRLDVESKEILNNAVELAGYLPELFDNSAPLGEDNGFEDALSLSKSSIVCEINPEGSAIDVATRMALAIDNLGGKKKDIFFYIVAGNLMEAGHCNPDFSVILTMMGERYNLLKWACKSDMDTPGRYLRAVVGIITHEGD